MKAVANAKEKAQLTDDRSTPPEPSVDDDDYDVGLEDPVIEGDAPTTWQEFAADARTSGSSDLAPIVQSMAAGDATLPSNARLNG